MLLNRLNEYAKSERVAYRYNNDDIKTEYTYSELKSDSDRIASYFKRTLGEDKSPVVVIGHKSHLMLAAFIGAVKSGRPYCPIDINTPTNRIKSIIEKISPSCVINLENIDFSLFDYIETDKILEIIENEEIIIESDDYVKPGDLYYIIYTSGSTGNPKGVMITYENLNNFVKWSESFVDIKSDTVFLNQAPYSFDLSVMDLYTGLSSGATIFSLDKNVQADYKMLLQELGNSNSTVWVSTPSFADLCLADRSFDDKLMPKLANFLFCGEVLTNKTCKRLKKRFPKAKIINTYGPTESTVAVTSIEITEDVLNKYDPLPIGTPKPGTDIIYICEEQKMVEAEKEYGELIITGDTLSPGYYKEQELTSKVFKKLKYSGKMENAYYTGDLGYKLDGLYFCSGRKDNQIKMHGYRIELGDIETNLCHLEEVTQCAVLPHYVSGKVQRLTAYVVCNIVIEDQMEKAMDLKEKLQKYLQPYMIPQRFVFLNSLPMNDNGKIDRKALLELKS